MLAAAVMLLGCGARSALITCESGLVQACESFCGTGIQRCEQGEWTPCSASPPTDEITIAATARDFHADHQDFEGSALGLDLGIVEPLLGADGKPVYAAHPSTPTTSGKASFDRWFRDVPGVNESTSIPITLVSSGGDEPVFRFDSQAFFPIDGQLFGNEGNPHNYHFTVEMVVDFRYRGGEVFSFRGDDDVFAFIHGHLAIDLGGVHSAESGSVDLDAVAGSFGLTPGDVYTLSLFFAERHMTSSSFRVETTIAEFAVCPAAGP
ncbi:Multiple EGF-like-domain protein 3 precursor [Minicystis rosea]|nr:Multiple EGF-like-domain protein 3 precursor [Minicystis rosea]